VTTSNVRRIGASWGLDVGVEEYLEAARLKRL